MLAKTVATKPRRPMPDVEEFFGLDSLAGPDHGYDFKYPRINGKVPVEDLTIPWLALSMWLLGEADAQAYSGAARKYIAGVNFVIPGFIWEKGWSVPLNILGYGGKSKDPAKAKLTRLASVYFNPESAAAAREKLQTRIEKKEDVTSVTVSLINGEKDSRSQGHCMAAATVTYIHKPARGGDPILRVTIFYRVTESIRKFGADLAFLHRIVLPAILPDNAPPLTQVEFKFSNIYLSPVYLPILWEFIDPVEMLEFYKEGPLFEPGQNFFRQVSRQTVWPALYPDKIYNYRERQLMHDIGKAHIDSGLVDGEALKQYVFNCGEYSNDDLVDGSEEEDDK